MILRYLSRPRSFRIRIALLSTLLSATVLLAFGVWTWEAVQRNSMRRIDQNIRELGDRNLGIPQGPNYWERVQELLEFVLGDLYDDPFTFAVKDRNGEVVYRSENWPEEISTDAFPTPMDAGFTEEPEPWRPPHGRSHRPPPDAREPESPPASPDESFRREMRRPRRVPRFLREDIPFPPGPPPWEPMPVVAQSFFTTRAGGHAWRFGVMSNPEVTLALGLNLAPHAAEMARLSRLFSMAAPAALLLIAIGGWWLAQRALGPVLRLTRAAEGITARGLDQRIPIGQADAEFDRLIRVFNGMLDRLEKSFQQAVRFSADAAHELKTPLTILQGELAEAVQSAAAESEHQETLGRLLDEVQRLKNITHKLLLLSLADSGQLRPQMEPVNLSEMLEPAGEDIQALAPDLRVQMSIALNLWINADPDLFQQVVQNLVSNSVKYNAPDGTVAIELRREADRARLTIGNSGPGIPAADRDRIFERFYRADKARNRQVEGVGLGLSLAREIVRAHHGELLLEEARDGWTAFSVVIPVLSQPPAETK